MTRLFLDGVPVAEVERARSLPARFRGLLERDGIATGLVLTPASSVHTLGMRFALDKVHVARSGKVPPPPVPRPRPF
jgi:hypothetical protein